MYFFCLYRFYFGMMKVFVVTKISVKPGKRVLLLLFFLLKMSESVILVETVQTKPYIFL